MFEVAAYLGFGTGFAGLAARLAFVEPDDDACEPMIESAALMPSMNIIHSLVTATSFVPGEKVASRELRQAYLRRTSIQR